MKRTAPQSNAMAVQPSSSITATQSTNLANEGGKAPRKQATPKSQKVVDDRLFERASAREQANREWTVRLAQPVVYSVQDQPTGLFDMPEAVLNLINEQCNGKLTKFLRPTCRADYRYDDTLNPLRRLPGLIGDLKSVMTGQNLTRGPAFVAAFLDALELKGGYDRVLLTPLSPEVRCAAGFGSLLLTQFRLKHAREKYKNERDNELALLSLDFVEENYNAGFLPGLQSLLPLAPKLTTAKTRTESIEIFFRSSRIKNNEKCAVFSLLL